jgi:hypothetical protein
MKIQSVKDFFYNSSLNLYKREKDLEQTLSTSLDYDFFTVKKEDLTKKLAQDRVIIDRFTLNPFLAIILRVVNFSIKIFSSKTTLLDRLLSLNAAAIELKTKYIEILNLPQIDKNAFKSIKCINNTFLSPFIKVAIYTLQEYQEFEITQLTSNELTSLYQTFICCRNALDKASPQKKIKRETIQKYLFKIERHVFSLCSKGDSFVEEFLSCLSHQKNTQLEEFINKIKEWKELFAKFQGPDLKGQLLAHINDFYKNIKTYEDQQRELKFACFLDVADALLPNAHVYKWFFDTRSSEQVRNIPKFEAIKSLIHYFNKEKASNKYTDKLSDIDFCEVDQLTAHLNALNQENFQGEKRIIVFHPSDDAGHYSTIFLKRVKHQVLAVIVEAGLFKNIYHCWISKIQAAINKSSIKDVKMYSFDPFRQTDQFSCPIVACRDILENTKQDIIEHVQAMEKIPGQFRNHEGIVVISQYPANFMKVKQSVSYLKDYEKENKASKQKIVSTKACVNGVLEHKTLKEVVDKHTLTSNGRKMNFYLRKRAFKYFTIMVSKLLNTH